MNSSIHVNQISKRYRIGRGLTNLRELFSSRKTSDAKKYHWAVKDINFSLEPGEAIGIIGPNGAGKTTILKLLSSVTKPTSGEISINGRLSALIELGAGFHPDLTGRDNIYLNGTILGMRRADIKARFDQIVDFAGIGEYLDTPVKRYSSGMYARLGFAIAAHVDPQILLVDEVLAVGDYAFQQKCYARMDALRKAGTSIIFVSHNMDAVRRVCERGLVLYRGEDIFHGTSAEAIIAYSDALREAARNTQVEIPKEEGISQRVMTFEAEIEKVFLKDKRGQPVTVVTSGQSASVIVEALVEKEIHAPIFSLMIRSTDGSILYDTTTNWMGIQTPDFKKGDRIQVEFEIYIHLLQGEYDIGVDITTSDFSRFYDSLERALSFSVVGPDSAKGVANLDAKIRVLNLSKQPLS